MPTQETEIAGETTDAGRGRVFPCENCGADLVFEIGQQSLKCPYCGHEKKIELAADAEIHEQDFPAMLDKLKAQKSAAATEPETDPDGNNEVRCQSCGGTVLFVGTLTSTECPYCGSPIQREHVHSATNRIPVDGVLPFLVPKEQAHTLLSEWVTSRWFAPNEYLKRGIEGKFNGVYLPYWTFDTLTLNAFSGSRGDTYTIVVGSGNNQRIETHIRWTAASGRFQLFFDDILIVASKGLPENYIMELEPWPLKGMIPFTQQVLSGFFARTYDIDLEPGFAEAKARADASIQQEVRARIGGDQQAIDWIKTRCDAITFKHVLLPVWILAYQYQGKAYRVFINGGTGEVQGERPYSTVKIACAVIAAVVAIGVVASQR